ncbi:MAG TPA: hypothetical protein VEA69_09675 [Tepidisphaeraceae bacterium]|nr:hypothetical protein [Tepidisphaeraceae bacterium]
MRYFHKSAGHTNPRPFGKRRFEHWYRDNTAYFITASTRGHARCFETDEAKWIFWDRFEHYTREHAFETWVVTPMDTHYHFIGHLRNGKSLGEMMRKLHGPVAKLVNDTLEDRHRPFWRDKGGMDYFDGCLRDARQLRKAYCYTQLQSERHGVCRDWSTYKHTRIYVPLHRCAKYAVEREVFMSEVEYARYPGKGSRKRVSKHSRHAH